MVYLVTTLISLFIISIVYYDKAQKFDIYQWLDYRNKLSRQRSTHNYLVLYLTSGTFLASTVVDQSANLKYVNDGIEIPLSGFIADTKSYYYYTSNIDEAYYVTAILNSTVIDSLIKPVQSKGLWGPRDIHKKPLEFSIPMFSDTNSLHLKLSRLGSDCSSIAYSSLPNLITKLRINSEIISANEVGRLRTSIREVIANKLSEINYIVCDLVGEKIEERI